MAKRKRLTTAEKAEAKLEAKRQKQIQKQREKEEAKRQKKEQISLAQAKKKREIQHVGVYIN